MPSPLLSPPEQSLPVATDSPIPNPVRPMPGRIYARLPRMWIGIVIAVICLLFQIPGEGTDALVWLVSMIGTCYWLFCIHRIHKVLSEYTSSAYPISARKAVGFQVIPLFQYYWYFRWTRQLARFLDEHSGKPGAPKVWPGLLLTATSMLGWFTLLKSLRLFLIFGFGIYLTKKLRAVLPACRPLRVRRLQQWNLAMSAGVGAAFSFVLVQALRHFSVEDPVEKLHELAAIFMVSIGVLIFLEPLFEHLRVMLGIAHDHPALHSRRSWLLRFAVFGILVFTSLFHGLMHSEIENGMKYDWLGTVTMLLAGVLLSGGITYFWVAAAHRRPSHAAMSGLISGSVLGFLVASAVLAAVSPSATAPDTAQGPVAVVYREFPLVPSRVLQEVQNGTLSNDVGLTQTLLMALPWPILGLIGGVAIDRRWAGKVHSVALSMFAVATLYAAILIFTKQLASGGEILSHLSVPAGWGLALIVCRSSGILMPEETAEAPPVLS